jgi:multidrug efflux pump subunit AcrA (membrane-fusion protein)
MAAKLSIAGFSGKEFQTKVTRYAHAVDTNSRTMRTELDVPNSGGTLVPGTYASATFNLQSPIAPLILPSNTEIFQANGMQVGLVEKNNKVQLRNITIGRDLGTSVEILSGLQPSDSVIANPSDSLTDGEEVVLTNSDSRLTGE